MSILGFFLKDLETELWKYNQKVASMRCIKFYVKGVLKKNYVYVETFRREFTLFYNYVQRL